MVNPKELRPAMYRAYHHGLICDSDAHTIADAVRELYELQKESYRAMARAYNKYSLIGERWFERPMVKTEAAMLRYHAALEEDEDA